MNKKRIDAMIPRAQKALCVTGIAQKDGNGNYSVKRAFRGQISSFGATVTMSTLRAAVAMYSQNGDASVERKQLLCAIDYCLGNDEPRCAEDIFTWVCTSTHDMRKLTESFVEASVAIKLAMNCFLLVESEED